MVIETIASRYYQLYLEPTADVFASETYRNIVLRGERPPCVSGGMPPGFCGTAEDRLFAVQTPAGAVDIAYLADRNDFERMVMILGRSAAPVPATMGSCTFFGLVNWRRIEEHKRAFLAAGGTERSWDEEFAVFTGDKSRYEDTLVLAGKGGYSGVPAARAGYDERAWNEYSLRIRVYHECTHVVRRAFFPGTTDPLYDEVLADCIGLCAAFGRYDESLARLFLGITEDGTYTGGRLRNYFPHDADMTLPARRAADMIASLSRKVGSASFPAGSDEQLFRLACRCCT